MKDWSLLDDKNDRRCNLSPEELQTLFDVALEKVNKDKVKLHGNVEEEEPTPMSEGKGGGILFDEQRINTNKIARIDVRRTGQESISWKSQFR